MSSWKGPQPCKGCGGPKPAGIGRKLCEPCLLKSQERQRAARADYHRTHYQENRARIRRYQSERYWSDPEVRKAKSARARQWALEHPEQMRENRRRSWAKNNYGLTLAELDA